MEHNRSTVLTSNNTRHVSDNATADTDVPIEVKLSDNVTTGNDVPIEVKPGTDFDIIEHSTRHDTRHRTTRSARVPHLLTLAAH